MGNYNDDEFDNACSKLAESLNCHFDTVWEIFAWIPYPMRGGPSLSKDLLERANQQERLSKLAKRFEKELAQLDEWESERLQRIHGVSAKFFEKLSIKFDEEATSKRASPRLRRSAIGGKNWTAEDVSNAMAELFQKLEKPITFGHMEGIPTTDFGRSVQLAFHVFELRANWREPARSAMHNTKLGKNS